jgi:TolB-like protein/DNA-binding winged helix-turn-helix (wHTH) protein
MDPPADTALMIGAWRVDPATNQIARDGETLKLEARTMRLLLCLAERAGQTIDTNELMDRLWAGTIVTQDSVYQGVASLRRILGDDAKNPSYIVTVPRRGYRLIAKVAPQSRPPPAPRARYWKAGLAVGLAVLFVTIAGLIGSKLGTPAGPPSVAVLPFLDLTSQSMDEEYFADGMTEELIDRLSQVPELRVPSPTAVFYFKGRHEPVNAIASSLKVAYVVEGSVRRSGETLRIAARLIRAEDGSIVWSETYDRESRDLLQVQDEIASEVVKALSGSQLLAH